MEIKSIITTDLDHCYLCGRPYPQIHHIMNKWAKAKSEEYGLLVPVCYICHAMLHDKEDNMLKMRQLGQRKFEEIYSRELWIQEFGKNYLKEE